MKILHNKKICCRHCNYETKFKFVDLGNSPPSNEYLTEKCLDMPEIFTLCRFLYAVTAG